MGFVSYPQKPRMVYALLKEPNTGRRYTGLSRPEETATNAMAE